MELAIGRVMSVAPGLSRGCIRKRIDGLELCGENASFERELYKSWIICPSYAEADKKNLREGRYSDWALVGNRRERALKTGRGYKTLVT